MSTSGGSRGERQAKPKFAALDINRLYKSSRGESLEPSTQKNQIPRKHGMQSLGKVPSARRPPANLPSLKAEINSPTTGASSNNNSNNPTGQDQQINATHIAKSSATSNFQQNQQPSVVSNNTNSINNNTTGGNLSKHNSNNFQKNSSGGGYQQQNNTGSNNSVTWSSVTTGGQQSDGLPPLYQSLQFQHEFPSLDGKTQTQNVGKTQNYNRNDQTQNQSHIQNYKDGNLENEKDHYQYQNEVNLRPQTDAASWLQQQQGSGRNSDSSGGMKHSSTPSPAIPAQCRALLPPFMVRGQPSPEEQQSGIGTRSLTPPMNQGGGGGQYQNGGNFSMTNQGNRSQQQSQQRDRTSPNTTSGGYRQNQIKRPPPLNVGRRHHEQELDVTSLQRPIIRDEDLLRMDNIAKDDGWTEQDEIDYNQKLNFSDDESPDNSPGERSQHPPQFQSKDNRKQQRQREDNRWSGARADIKDRSEEKIDKDIIGSNENRSSSISTHQQNGPRASGALEPSIFERVKQRKEEEERREMERKQAAAKKLQELEMKMIKKPTVSPDIEDKQDEDPNYSRNNRFRTNDNKDNFGRFEKYERNQNPSQQPSSSLQRSVDPKAGSFPTHFQSNLPPRFLRQQQSTTPTTGSTTITNTTQNNAQGSLSQKSVSASSQQRSEQKNCSTNGQSNTTYTQQQFDTRHTSHSQQNYNKQPLRRHPSDDTIRRPQQQTQTSSNMNYRRQPVNEEDDRFNTNIRSGGIMRSISGDSQNQRKISVSSNDDQKLSESFHSMRSSSSWADDNGSLDIERRRNESISSNDHNQSGTSNKDDCQPKQILQRPQRLSESSRISESSRRDEEQHQKVPTQILRRSESPQQHDLELKLKDSTKLNEEKKLNQSETTTIPEEPSKIKDNTDKTDENGNKQGTIETNQKRTDQRDNREQHTDQKDNREREHRNQRDTRDHRDNRDHRDARDNRDIRDNRDQRDLKRPSPRNVIGNRDRDIRNSRGSYNSYRGVSSWGRRGAPGTNKHGRSNYDYSESDEESDDGDYKRSDKNYKVSRKEGTGKDRNGNKEGFAPRGEPSRRGRGSSGNLSYRRSDGRSQQNSVRETKRSDSFSSSKNFHSLSNNTSSNQAASKPVDDKKLENVDDKTKLNQMALTSGLQTKKEDEKNKSQTSQSKSSTPPQQNKRDEVKKSTPPKSYGNLSYGISSRKDSTIQKDEKIEDKDQVERKKSLSKEKELLPQPQRSQSSGQISNSRSQQQAPQYKRDERSSQQTQAHKITKPPPGLGFKQTSNINSQQLPKEQPLAKSKSTSDTRSSTTSIDSRGSGGRLTDSKPQRNKQWEKPVPSEGNKNLEEISADKKEKILENTTTVSTIIFENTKYKPATTVQQPIKRQNSNQPSGEQIQKKDDFKCNTQEQSKTQQQNTEAISAALSQISFSNVNQQKQKQPKPNDANEYDKEINLGFFDSSEFSHLSNKSEDSNISMSNRSNSSVNTSQQQQLQQVTSQQSTTISPSTADLNMKIASVKKVWESVAPMPTVLENAAAAVAAAAAAVSTVGQNNSQQNDVDTAGPVNFNSQQQQQQQQQIKQFVAQAAALQHQHAVQMHHQMQQQQHALSSPGPTSFGSSAGGNSFEPSLDHFVNKQMIVDDSNDAYSSSPQHHLSQSHQNTTAQMNLAHVGDVPSLSSKVKSQIHQSSGLGLSPPPSMQQQQPQNSSQQQLHQNPAQQFYSQYNPMPTIPSPPAVQFHSSQAGIYAPFQIEPNGRSAAAHNFSHNFANHYGAPTGNAGPYTNAYTMQATGPSLQTAQAPPPDMYQNLTSQFRMGNATGGPPPGPPTHFNQSQQLNNPNTAVLISGNSNTLISSSGKPPGNGGPQQPPGSTQQIGPIGSNKNAAAAMQQYLNLYPQQATHAPPMQSANSYYSANSGGQGAGGFYGSLPPPAGGNQQNYGMPPSGAAIFGSHGGGGPPPSSGPPQQQMPNFGSQFMNSPLLAATINQYRGGLSHSQQSNTSAYMKSNQSQNHLQDSMGRQLKSPSGTEITLNMSKQVQSQQSPPHHKNYAQWDLQNQVLQQQSQQNRGSNGPNGLQTGRSTNNQTGNPNNSGNGQTQRYPTPIGRPTNYPPQHQQIMPPQAQQQSQQGRPIRPQPQPQQGSTIPKNYFAGNNRGHTTSDQQKHQQHQKDVHNQQNAQQTAQQQQQQQQQNQSDLPVKNDNTND